MATRMGDLLHDVKVSQQQLAEAQVILRHCEKRLIDALATASIPLSEKSSVVIGTTLVNRPYNYLGLELIEIENVSPNLAVDE